jgi:peptidoglycan-associated lipoprotein
VPIPPELCTRSPGALFTVVPLEQLVAFNLQHLFPGMTIEGHCDERGTREYNIALGQRRAVGVKQMMILLGVQEAQIEAVSFGEEKSRSSGKDDTSMAENRRSDIAYDGE